MPDEPNTTTDASGTQATGTTTTGAGTAPAGNNTVNTGTEDVAGLKAALESERGKRREAEKAAKDSAGYKTKLDELAAAAMTDQEKAVAKAVAEAETRSRTATLASTASRLARAELRAAASGRVEATALDGFLEYADLTKFVGDDGEPNEKAIKAAIDKLAGPQRTSFDGGARQSAPSATDMNALIREKAFGR
jgi:hypothetical protein